MSGIKSIPRSCKSSATDVLRSWLLAPPAIILQLRSLIEDCVNIPPTAQGANKSQSKVKESSIHVIFLSLMVSSFNLSISDIKTFAPAPARYSASFFPTLPAP